MKAPFPSLLRFYILSLYGLRGRASGSAGWQDTAAVDAARPDPKARAKAIAKTIGIAVLAVMVIGELSGMFFATNYAMYKALKPVGLQGLLILNAAMSASLLVFLLGFATALSTYSLSTAENVLLSLPIRPRNLLGAKLMTVYLSDTALAFLLMITAFGIYAWGERPGAPFYLFGVLTIIALPLAPVALSYLILVPLMSTARFLRNKNLVTMIGALVGLAFALAFNLFIQSAAMRMTDLDWIRTNYAGPDAFLSQAGRIYLPALLAWMASLSGWTGFLYALANLALGLGAVAAVAVLLGPAYAASLSRFGEGNLRKLKSARGFIARRIKRSSPTWSLFLREFNLMNREPVYFLNGPFIILMMPVILAVGIAAQGNRLSDLLLVVGGLKDGPWLMLMAAGFGAFLGSATSITCTSVSRDAKALPYLKALPIPLENYVMAKFLHGFAFSLFGGIVGSLGLGLFAGLSPLAALGAFFIGISVSAFVDIAGLWIDTANPRLSWDSPTAALKQNPNSVIVILGMMGLLGIMGALSPVLGFGSPGFVAAYGGLPATLTVIGLRIYPRFASKRIAALEA